MAEVIRLTECSSAFLTRRQGELVRERLVKELKSLDLTCKLRIDCSGVSEMTPSFADECFGKLLQYVGAYSFRSRISLVGADDTIKVLINAILAQQIEKGASNPVQNVGDT